MPENSPDSETQADQSHADNPGTKPTTIRLNDKQRTGLDEIGQANNIPRNTLLSLAVDSFLDFVHRTGRLPLPAAKQRRHKTHGTTKG